MIRPLSGAGGSDERRAAPRQVGRVGAIRWRARCNLGRVGLVSVAVDADHERAFSLFVRERGSHLLRYARLLIPDDGEAEDALQTALLRLTRHWSKHLDHPDAYVRASLLNHARDRGRRRHLVAQPALLVEPQTAKCGDLAEAQAARSELDAALVQLPSRQRAAVVLRVIEGLSEAETAALMGTSVGAAKSNLSRGLHKLRLVLSASSSCLEGTQL